MSKTGAGCANMKSWPNQALEVAFDTDFSSIALCCFEVNTGALFLNDKFKTLGKALEF